MVLVLEVVEAQLDAAVEEIPQGGHGAFDRVVRNLSGPEPAIREVACERANRALGVGIRHSRGSVTPV